MLFYTGITRQADVILSEQKANIDDKRLSLDRIKAQVAEVEACSSQWQHEQSRAAHAGRLGMEKADGGPHQQLRTLTRCTNAPWMPARPAARSPARAAAASCCLYCPPDRQSAVREVLSEMKELPFSLERDGTKVIFNARR